MDVEAVPGASAEYRAVAVVDLAFLAGWRLADGVDLATAAPRSGRTKRITLA